MNSFPTRSTNFQQGSIFHGKMPLSDGLHRNKFLIILNKNPKDPIIYFCFTTSRMKFYNKYPLYRSHFIKIPEGTFKFFNVKTLINLSTIHSRPRHWFDNVIQRKQLKFIKILPPNYLDKIKKIVESSVLIEKNIKGKFV